MKKKIGDLTEKEKIEYCNTIKIACNGCKIDCKKLSLCLKSLDIKSEIKFYKNYVAELERIAEVEVEL